MKRQVRSLISWVVVGLVIGLLASAFADNSRGIWFYLGAGLVGALAGGLLAQFFRLKLNSGNPFLDRIVFATVGAIIVLLAAPAII